MRNCGTTRRRTPFFFVRGHVRVISFGCVVVSFALYDVRVFKIELSAEDVSGGKRKERFQ